MHRNWLEGGEEYKLTGAGGGCVLLTEFFPSPWSIEAELKTVAANFHQLVTIFVN